MKFQINEDGTARYWHESEAPCGVYWIITTCLTGIALGIGFGGLLWLVLS